MLANTGRTRNRVVLLTITVVALAGVLVGSASFIRTRNLTASYEDAMQTELRAKGLAYGQTTQSLLTAFAKASPEAFDALLKGARDDPSQFVSQFEAERPGEFRNIPLTLDVWTSGPSAAEGYSVLFRSDFQGGPTPTTSNSGATALVAQTAATGAPAASVDAGDEELHSSFLINAPDQAQLIAVVTLDARQEFAFIEAQQARAVRDAIIFAAASIVFVSLVGGGLSYLLSRTLTNLRRAEEKLQTATATVTQAREETVLLLAASAEAHDANTGRHLHSVRNIAEVLALELGHSEAQAREIGLAATLHDIGKIRVPDDVLATANRLTPDEWAVMKQHTTWGGEFLSDRPGFELATMIARSHHERWDGSGYPAGLAGDAIAEGAAITSVADALDAMTGARSYRSPRSVEDAVQEVMAKSGTQFSPAVVAALLRVHERGALPIATGDREQQQAA